MSKLISTVLVLTMAGICVAGDQARSKVTQVSLFKNGLAYVNERLSLPADSEQFSFTPAAAPSHGSFWISYSPDLQLASLIAEETNVPGTVQAANMFELFAANIGAWVHIEIGEIGNRQGYVEGKITGIEPAKPQPYAMGTPVNYQDSYNHYRDSQRIQSGDIVVVQSGNEFKAVPLKSIRTFTFNKAPKQALDTKSAHLLGKLSKSSSAQDVDISYLCKGMMWAPSYLISITDADGNAPLSAKAEVLNEIADLEDVQLQLITGYPNLQFAQIYSPIALKENLAQFLYALGRGSSENLNPNAGRLGGVASNVMRQVAYDMREEMAYGMPAYGQAEQGVTAEDLFFYPLKNVSLKKGQVGYFPLFTENVAYKHLYTWEIPDKSVNRNYYNRNDENRPEDVEEVWHCLKLTNNMKLPWTTAPVQIMSNAMIIGQDTLNYTAVSATTKLKITIASSVRAQQQEFQLERQRNAAQFYGNSYDLVKVKGVLSVTNYQSKAIAMEITKDFSGDLKSAQPEAKSDKLPAYLNNVNNRGKIVWNLTLDPGQKQDLEFVYEIYVRQ